MVSGGNLGPVTCQACVIDPYSADLELFDFFMKGETLDEVARRLQRSSRYPEGQDYSLIKDDIGDHYRCFNYLLHYLQRPQIFMKTCPVPLGRDVRAALLTRYYRIDHTVCMELYGKKPKDLRSKVVADRYQVENAKLVYKTIVKDIVLERDREHPSSRLGSIDFVRQHTGESLTSASTHAPYALAHGVRHGDDEDTLEQLITHHFELPAHLARTYAVLCFSVKWNFNLEKVSKRSPERSGKRWDDLQNVTLAVMTHWADRGIHLNSGFEESLKTVKEMMKDTVLDAYCEKIVAVLAPSGPRAAPLPVKTQKIVRACIVQLLSFASGIGHKLSALFSICEAVSDDACQGLDGLRRHGGVALLEAAVATPLMEKPTRKNKLLTDTAKTSWMQLLRVCHLVVQYLAGESGTPRAYSAGVVAHGPARGPPPSTQPAGAGGRAGTEQAPPLPLHPTSSASSAATVYRNPSTL